MRFLFIVLIFCSGNLYSQVNSHARTAGMGNTDGSIANLAVLDASSATLGYTKDMGFSNSAGFDALAIVSTNVGNFGLTAQQYVLGKGFKEGGIRLIYSRSLSARILTAFSVGYHQLSFVENYAVSRITFDVAARYYLKPEWLVGIQADPNNLIVDMSYMFDKKVLLGFESEYDWRYGFDFRTGLEYALIHWVWLRAGVSINHFKQFAGIGFSYKKIGLDLSLAHHPKMGYSSYISLNYVF